MADIVIDIPDKQRSRRDLYTRRRRELVDAGILPDRKAGRPRIYEQEEAVRVAREQRRQSYLRTAEHIRTQLALRAS